MANHMISLITSSTTDPRSTRVSCYYIIWLYEYEHEKVK